MALSSRSWTRLIWNRPQLPPPGLTAFGFRLDSHVATARALLYWSGKYCLIATRGSLERLQAVVLSMSAKAAMVVIKIFFTRCCSQVDGPRAEGEAGARRTTKRCE